MWKATLLSWLGLRTAFRAGGALDRMALGMATNFLMVDGRNTNNVSETKNVLSSGNLIYCMKCTDRLRISSVVWVGAGGSIFAIVCSPLLGRVSPAWWSLVRRSDDMNLPNGEQPCAGRVASMVDAMRESHTWRTFQRPLRCPAWQTPITGMDGN